MREFNKNNKCAACGYVGAGMEYRERYDVEGPDTGYILRTCKQCGYTWREVPLYLAEKAPLVKPVSFDVDHDIDWGEATTTGADKEE